MLTRQLSHEGIDSIILELTTGVVDEGMRDISLCSKGFLDTLRPISYLQVGLKGV